MNIKIFLIVLLAFAFQGCREKEVEVKYYSNGKLVKLKGKNGWNACFTYYYPDDKTIDYEFCLIDSLIHGVYNWYFKNGNIKRRIHFDRGQIVGNDSTFYESGAIYKVIEFIPNSNNTQSIRFFNKNGTLKAFNLVENDSVYYIKSYVYDDNGQIIETIDAHNLLISVKKDTFKVNEPVEIHFYLPKCLPPYQLDNFLIYYDLYWIDGRKTMYPKPKFRGFLKREGLKDTMVFHEAGEVLIGTQMDYKVSNDSIIMQGISEKKIYIIE